MNSDDIVVRFICFFLSILALTLAVVSGVWLLALPFLPVAILCWWLDKKVFPEESC